MFTAFLRGEISAITLPEKADLPTVSIEAGSAITNDDAAYLEDELNAQSPILFTPSGILVKPSSFASLKQSSGVYVSPLLR